MVQFEISNNISPLEVAQKGASLNFKDASQLTSFIIGTDYEWKISDIDFVLKGNRIEF